MGDSTRNREREYDAILRGLIISYIRVFLVVVLSHACLMVPRAKMEDRELRKTFGKQWDGHIRFSTKFCLVFGRQ
jgi:hypothetical protein